MRGHLTRANGLKAAAIAIALGLFYWAVDHHEPRTIPTRAQRCFAVKQGMRTVPGGRDAAAIDLACATPKLHTVSGPPARTSSVGFDTAHTTPIAHHGRLPFSAARAGTLPRSGRGATVAGVALPTGTRHKRYWVADAESPDAITVASRLARAFPNTGLWPVLWDWQDEGPEGYAYNDHTPREADGIDALWVLNHIAYHDRRVSGLAPKSPLPAKVPDPFAQLALAPGALESPIGQRLVLVAVRRPADVIVQTGFASSGLLSTAAQTAVARSWEERFGATVTVMSPGGFGMSVAAPPAGYGAAAALVAEQNAYAPDDEEQTLRSLRAKATRGFWSLGWPD